ncbi:23S rRNA pseudouridine(2604) synthase RluF [Moritella viscosa]|uniref:Pseudouridine synthase n=1 Tax=Moritella viscosa TaxID=80854 RepID=A0A1L0B9V2_9GAMM|nr:23S rRNA pseudouridine(2604) synthase RluF [Moritella viscosa]SGY99664.1 Pseudouridine synthase [Moritella viscosa]SGZ14518.1 Pseudouridine synthase [Moritella viscosa]SGZ14742.1 Pseudouridine synthase [Moritella viscosa]SHO14035.1 Pseudouridine synthase [Moritella viscosa]SHO14037.1 Pseudouridine synthase [Moritella viscosa]
MTQQDIKLTRLNKYISDTGYCSRREADRLIEQGRVTINGKIPEMGTKVSDSDMVSVNGKPVKEKQKRIYIALNKPAGITCTTERHIQGNVIDLIDYNTRIFPIGRLDKPSEGLIFLTNDGDIVNKILRAGNAHEKEYIVKVDSTVTDKFLTGMARGVPILDTVTKPCKVTREGRFEFKIILTQGLNQQIRRMCEHFGFQVKSLTRTRIMNIDMKGLATGQWRLLTDKEMAAINSMVEGSSSTEEASDYGQEKPKTKGVHSKRGVNSAARQKRFGYGDYAATPGQVLNEEASSNVWDKDETTADLDKDDEPTSNFWTQNTASSDADVSRDEVQQDKPASFSDEQISSRARFDSAEKRKERKKPATRLSIIAEREKAKLANAKASPTAPRVKGTLSLKKK